MNLNIDNLKETARHAADVVGDAAEKVKDALGNLPGAAINKADDNKVSSKLEKERTCTLNNNPRNDEGPQA